MSPKMREKLTKVEMEHDGIKKVHRLYVDPIRVTLDKSLNALETQFTHL